MHLDAIRHRSSPPDCYALDEHTAVLNIQTGKDITAVSLIYEDPYAYGISGDIHWVGKALPMQPRLELKHSRIWTVKVQPAYKRLQYYFEIFSGDEKVLLFEDDCYTEAAIAKKGSISRCRS